jgi:hypothetical protein
LLSGAGAETAGRLAGRLARTDLGAGTSGGVTGTSVVSTGEGVEGSGVDRAALAIVATVFVPGDVEEAGGDTTGARLEAALLEAAKGATVGEAAATGAGAEFAALFEAAEFAAPDADALADGWLDAAGGL